VIKPMLCFDAKGDLGVVPREGWVMEIKLDGVRWQSWVGPHDPRHGIEVRHWIGRNGNRATATAEVDTVLRQLPSDTVLDGELMTEGAWGARAGGKRKQLVVFDVLRLAGFDVTTLPWSHRRELLEKLAPILGTGPDVMLAAVAPVDEATLEKWLELGFEGAVAKREASLYRPGKRSRDWLKIKPQETAEAVVIGWEYGKGASNRQLCGALQIRMLETNAETTTGWGGTPAEADAMVGRIVEVRHHGISATTGKPRHPVKPKLRPDLETT
jgi:bifunctional non-homologous end joining protein LigD